MIKGFLTLPWFAWAGIALAVAIAYSFFGIPQSAFEATGFRYFTLRWGHACVWYLLTINFVLRGISPNLNGIADIVAGAGGILYLVFMLMAFVIK
ncbi:MAG: hypothetical protein UZ14_CFX002001480 [Chloroflexi bacterium OLB14]|nr:MAG: hypothetical protein UZ14_CFX002001480 [Chloroflexi bacterium OLB14]